MSEIDIEYRPWTWRPPEGGAIGKRGIRRKDGDEKASGKAIYSRDIYRPGMLFAKPLTSPYAHARIKSMDLSKALALKGVRDIIRYDDEGVARTTDNFWGTLGGELSATGPILTGEAQLWGDPVGVIVIADSDQICDEALRLIEIDWEELPFVIDWEKSLDESTPLLRPDLNPDSNIKHTATVEYGNVEEGFQEADQVIEFSIKAERDVWAGVEAYTTVAEWKGENVEVWYSGQTPQWIEKFLAKYFGGFSKTTVHSLYTGARLGGLTWTPFESVVPQWAAIAAKRVGRPVKVTFDGSHFYGAEDRAGTYNFKIGFKNTGVVTALEIHTFYCGQTMHDHLSKIREHSSIKNMLHVDVSPFANTGAIVCAKHGAPATMVSSMTYNRVAGALNMDPAEVAMINDGCSGHSMDYVNEHIKKAVGMDPNSDSLKDCINACKKSIDFDNKWHLPGQKILSDGRYHGIGAIFCIQWAQGNLLYGDGCNLKYNGDGTLSIIGRHGDGGWNSETTYCQVVADETGFKYEDVSHRQFDGEYDLAGGGGSYGTCVNMFPLVASARAMKRALLEKAVGPNEFQFFAPVWIPTPSLFPGKTLDELDIKDGMIFEKANPSNCAPVSAITKPLFAREYGKLAPLPEGVHPEVMARQAHYQEIAIDPETGQVEVLNMAIAQDVGQALNPDSCNGQTYGGAIWGVGRSYLEREIFDPVTGVMLNDNLCWYSGPTILDYGPNIDTHLIENHLGWTVYGIYGIGESGSAVGGNLAGPAVFNAIGKWIDDYPITPEKILKALGKI